MNPFANSRSAAASYDLDDADQTVIDARANRRVEVANVPAEPRAPRKPTFVAAETVVPIVSYRVGAGTPVQVHETSARSATPPSPGASVRREPTTPPPSHMWPTSTQAMAAVQPVEHYVAPIDAPRARGELTVVFGCRGGAGATTLAVNTAAAIARTGRSVCIVDFDLQLGDVFTALGLEAQQTSLASVAREAHALDGVSLRRRLAQHPSGVCALAQAGHIDDLDPAIISRLPALLDTLRMHFDHVIVDGVRDFGDAALAALEAATKILVVITQDVPAVRRAARVLGLVQRLGIEEHRCAVVVNRAVKSAAVNDAAIARALALPVAARVREDRKAASALDAGALFLEIARSRPIIDDVAQVAALCQPAGAPRAPEPRKKRWFGKAGA